MKSMVCDYGSVERELRAYETLSHAVHASDIPDDGRKYVRQALDRFKLNQNGDRDYHFLIHKPLGVSAQHFLNLHEGRFPLYYARDLARQMLHALDFVHKAKVVHAGLFNEHDCSSAPIG